MSAEQSSGNKPEATPVPQPVENRGNDAVIENVYPEPGNASNSDFTSVDIAEDYLASRLQDDPTQSRQVVRRAINIPYPGRTPDGFRHGTRREKTDEWRVWPRLAATATLGTFVLANLYPAAQTVEGATQVAAYEAYRLFNPLGTTTKTTYHYQTSETITEDVTSLNTVGVAEVDREAVKRFADKLNVIKNQGGDISGIQAVGGTSDEFNGPASMWRNDAGNNSLGIRRATISADTLKELMGKDLPVAEISKSAVEHVITDPAVREDLVTSAKTEGYPDITDAITAVDHGKTVSPGLKDKIKQFFTSKRKGTLSATVTMPGKLTKTEVQVPEKDNPPKMPDVDWNLLVVPIPFWRKRERVTDTRPKNRWSLKSFPIFLKPKVIEEKLNNAWVRLRPEAMQKDGTLVDAPWAYSRKYEALLREGRIKDVMRADYKVTGEDEEATEKSLRIMFVDHTPADETVQVFAGLLQKFAHMQDGRLADKISGIFVYPSANAVRKHQNPKKIGMGVDKQYDADTIGVLIPLLELVEMHMDTTMGADELATKLNEFMGPAWALAHEVAGHGADTIRGKQKIEPVRAKGIKHAHIPKGNSSEHYMAVLEDTPSIAERRKEEQPLAFDISYTVLDGQGKPVVLKETVTEHDPRLAFAGQAKIRDTRPTHYAAESNLEHQAEVAASVTTGIRVPYGEAKVTLKPGQTTDGTPATANLNGYAPDEQAQHVFTQAVGGEKKSYPITFAKPVDVEIVMVKPEDDPLIREHLIRARKERFAKSDDMLSILTKIEA